MSRRKPSHNHLSKQGRIRHDKLVKIIFDDPATLGLDLGQVLSKTLSPEPIQKGKEMIDIILVAETNSEYRIWPIEVKSGYKQAAINKAKRQLGFSQRYLKKNWQQWLTAEHIQPNQKLVLLYPLLVFAENNILIKDMCQPLSPMALGIY